MKILAAGLLTALVVAGAASAAKPTETRLIDTKDGFSVLLPAKWYAVPSSTTAIQNIIAALKKKKETAVATEYSYYLTTPGKAQLKAFVLEAFLDISPSTDPIYPTLEIQIVKPTKGKPYTTADLRAVADTYASAIASGSKTGTMAPPKSVKLPEGAAEMITGSVPVGSGLSDGFKLYFLEHSGKVYVLKFDIDATILAKATVFQSIAEHFAWA